MIRFRTVAAAGLAVGLAAGALAATPSESALQSMHDALEHNPEEVSTLVRLSTMLRELGLDADADEALRRAVEIDPSLDIFSTDLPADGCEGCDRGVAGPDVIVGDLNGISNYNSAVMNGTRIHAFAIGTTSCNIGDQILSWVSGTNQHPVIGQNVYRYLDGRFEQVGQSHLKHGFLALSGSLCTPCQGGGGSFLGVGCSDPYGSSLNGSQGNLGPRWQVNAATGHFPYPWHSAQIDNGTIGRRLQIKDADLDPELNAGARYFGEGQYIHPQDAAFGNDDNNASYREMRFSRSGVNFFGSWLGATVRTKPAIEAWKAVDPEVAIEYVDVPEDGRFIVAYRVYDNGDGTWDYEYAIMNLNSDRSGQSFSVPASGSVTNIGFHDVDYHTGDGINGNTFDGTDWASAHSAGEVSWSTQTFAQNQNANALRWGTMYNFRFTADTAPEMTDATIGLFKPGAQGAVSVPVLAPACRLAADSNGDNRIDFADVNNVLNAFTEKGEGLIGDVNGDGRVDFTDLNLVLNGFGQEC